MTTTLLTLAAIGTSLAALAYLTATDPKRRRTLPAWLSVLLPGLVLLATAEVTVFVMWQEAGVDHPGLLDDGVDAVVAPGEEVGALEKRRVGLGDHAVEA